MVNRLFNSTISASHELNRLVHDEYPVPPLPIAPLRWLLVNKLGLVVSREQFYDPTSLVISLTSHTGYRMETRFKNEVVVDLRWRGQGSPIDKLKKFQSISGSRASWKQIKATKGMKEEGTTGFICVWFYRPPHHEGVTYYEQHMELDCETTLGDVLRIYTEISSRSGWEHAQAKQRSRASHWQRVSGSRGDY